MHERGRGPNKYAVHTSYEPSPKLRKRRPPLRSFRELCEDLGVKPGQLTVALGQPGAPKAILHHNACFGAANHWYDPVEVRRWWNSRSSRSNGEST